MRSAWIYWVIAGVFTHVACEKLSHWRNITFEFLEDQYVNTTKMSWWDATKSGCENGVLLPHGNILSNVNTNMPYWTRYWVGALEVYTPWKWTEDQSLLFVIRGSSNVSNYARRSRYTIQDNEPYLCYTKCKSGPVGLQGKYCYCLSRNIATITHVEGIRCPGSYDQFCGSDTTMSVYYLDIVQSLPFTPTDYATCGYFYGSKQRYGDDIYELKFDNSCHTNLTYACPEHTFKANRGKCVSGVCISYGWKTWQDAKKACGNKLIKLTTNVTQTLKRLISNTTSNWEGPYYNEWTEEWSKEWSEHWIGLKRNVTWKWINGIDFKYGLTWSNGYRPKCIAAKKRYSGRRKYIEARLVSCSQKLRAICQKYKPRTTTSTTSTSPATRTTSTTTRTMSTTIDVLSTEKTSPSSVQTGNTRSTQGITDSTDSQRQISQKSGSSGMIAGIAVGVIALLVLAGVVVLIWMKRNKRFLFKSAKLDHQRRGASPVHATTSVPNTYEQYDNNANNRIQYENVAYCAEPNTTATRGPIAFSSIIYDLAAADSAQQGPRELADLPNGIRPRDGYELTDPDDAKPETAYSADSSNYACPGDYFELEGPGDTKPETDDYELEGPADTAKYAVVDGKMASDEYNTLHETQRDRNQDLNYSHIGAADLTEYLYNTTEPAPHGQTDNEMYSHIKGDRFEDEDMYNHTDGSDDVPELYDPDYSHITTK